MQILRSLPGKMGFRIKPRNYVVKLMKNWKQQEILP